MRGPRIATILLVALGMVIPAAALGGVWKLKVNPLAEVPTREKLPIRVTLVLTKDCCELVKQLYAKWALGEALCAYAEEVARAAFAGFIRADDPTRGPEAETDAVLRLRFVDVSESGHSYSWNQMEYLIIIEWTALDREGRTLWMQTVRGVGRGKQGTIFTTDRLHREVMQAAFDDVFNQSLKQVISSPELRRLAK